MYLHLAAADNNSEKVIIMELTKGRPENTEGLQAREVRVYDFLDNCGISYERVDHHDKPAMTMEACEEIDRVLGVVMCKNLFL